LGPGSCVLHGAVLSADGGSGGVYQPGGRWPLTGMRSDANVVAGKDLTAPGMGTQDAPDDLDGRFTGDEARAAWRQVRGLSLGALAVYGAVLLMAWLLWHRTVSQLGWLAFALAAFTVAALKWRHDLVGFSYSTEGDEPTFVGVATSIPRIIAVPALVAAGIALFIAGTSTGLGRALASIFDKIQTVYSAGGNALGIVAVIIVIACVIVALVILARAVYQLSKFVIRGFRPDPSYEWHELIAVPVLLLIAGGISWALWSNRGDLLAPFHTIWSWFN
jgi:hypothetical protein